MVSLHLDNVSKLVLGTSVLRRSPPDAVRKRTDTTRAIISAAVRSRKKNYAELHATTSVIFFFLLLLRIAVTRMNSCLTSAN